MLTGTGIFSRETVGERVARLFDLLSKLLCMGATARLLESGWLW
jgi:hypothetical protein